jgi:hypothetical protein
MEESTHHQRRVHWMNRLHAVLPVLLFLALITMQAQTPQSNGKPTEEVVIQYEKLVAKGAFLTPEGWKSACKLFAQSQEFPARGEISLMSVGGSLGENWLKDNRAEVETKWTDYFGTIDATLRFHSPKRPPQFVTPTMSAFVFRLVYTNKQREIGAKGETIKEVTGPWEWKIEGPMVRWTTLEQAIKYVSLMRDKTDDPVIKKNAEKTIATLKRLGNACGDASACSNFN